MSNPSVRQRPTARGERRGFTEPAERAPMADAAPAPATSPRGQLAVASGLNVVAGVWLIIAPFVLGYGHGDPYWSDIVFGALIALVGLARVLTGARYAWLSGLNMLFGAWVFAAAFWLDGTARASWNDAIVGAIVFLLGAAAASVAAGRRAPRAA